MKPRLIRTDRRQEWERRQRAYRAGDNPPIFIEVTNRRGTSGMCVNNPPKGGGNA